MFAHDRRIEFAEMFLEIAAQAENGTPLFLVGFNQSYLLQRRNPPIHRRPGRLDLLDDRFRRGFMPQGINKHPGYEADLKESYEFALDLGLDDPAVVANLPLHGARRSAFSAGPAIIVRTDDVGPLGCELLVESHRFASLLEALRSSGAISRELVMS